MTGTEHAACLFCGGDITEEHDAVVLDSGDIAHGRCDRRRAVAGTDQGRLDDWGGSA